MPVPSTVPIWKGAFTDTSDVVAPGDYTFSAVDIGTEHPKRVVVVGVGLQNGTLSPVTIGGVTATHIGGGLSDGSLFRAVVPTGTTADIVCSNFLGTASYCVVGVWIYYPASAAPLDSVVNNTPGTTVTATDVEIVNGGCLIAWGVANGGLVTFTGAWSGTDTPTEDVDAQIDATGSYAGYSMPTTENLTTGDFTLTLSSSTGKRLVVASWGLPAADGQPTVKRFGGVPFQSLNRGVW